MIAVHFLALGCGVFFALMIYAAVAGARADEKQRDAEASAELSGAGGGEVSVNFSHLEADQ
jgi:hypothetical protein